MKDVVRKRLQLNTCLTVLLTFLILVHHLELLHAISGSFFACLAGYHFFNKKSWLQKQIKSFFENKKKTSRVFLVDIALALLLVISFLSGLSSLVMQNEVFSYSSIFAKFAALHHIFPKLIIGFIFIHVFQHRKIIVKFLSIPKKETSHK